MCCLHGQLSPLTHDFLDDVFPLDEAIIEAISGVEPPWEELHHRSYFLSDLDRMEHEEFREIISKNIHSPMVPLRSLGYMDDGNMENYHLLFLSIFLAILGNLRMSTLGRIVPLMRSRSIPSFLNIFVTYLLGHMKKFQVLTLVLSNMRLRPILIQSRFDNVCVS